jgi:solute carrier family 25 (mitochondrial oxoglutarate transporter), member 11
MSTNTLKQAAESARSKASNMTKQSSEAAAAVKADFLHTPLMRAALPFINGGLSGMVATTVIQPVDMVKVSDSLAALRSLRTYLKDLP